MIFKEFKLIKFYDNNELMLFNIKKDIKENFNLAASPPNKVEVLEKKPRWLFE